MDTQISDWFEAVEMPGGWHYALRPSDRLPVEWFRFSLPCIVGILILSALIFGHVVTGLMALLLFATWQGIVLKRRLGRDEFELDARSLRAIHHLGPISWSKTVRRSKVSQLIVVRWAWFPDDGMDRQDYYKLMAEDERGRKRSLVGSYPRESLLALAAELSSRWKALSVDLEWDEVHVGKIDVREVSEIPVDIEEESAIWADMSEYFAMPRSTRLIFEPGGNGVRIVEPPRGFLCTQFAVFMASSLVFLGTAVFWWYYVGGEGAKPWIVTGALVLMGLFAFLAAVESAVKGFVLIVTTESLELETMGLRGTCRKTWLASEILWVCAVSDSDVDKEGRQTQTTSVLVGRASSNEPKMDELGLLSLERWEQERIAATIRRVLGVPASRTPSERW